MKNGKLYIPNGSILYYIAVLLSFIGTAALIWCNLNYYGALNLELGKTASTVFPVWIYAVGAIHLTADLSIPIGYILAKKKLWLAGIHGWFGITYTVVFMLALMIQFTLQTTSLFNSLFNSNTSGFEEIIYFILALLIIVFIVVILVGLAAGIIAVASAIKALPYTANALSYHLANDNTFLNKNAVAVITSVSFLIIPLFEWLAASKISGLIGLGKNAFLLFVPYIIHSAAAVLMSLSLKSDAIPADEQDTVCGNIQAIPSEVPRSYKG